MRITRLIIIFCSLNVFYSTAQSSKINTKIIDNDVWMGHMIHGKPVGTWKVYNKENTLIKRVNYFNNNKAVEKVINHLGGTYSIDYCTYNQRNPFLLISNGPDTGFYDDRKIRSISFFKNAKGEGLYLYFDEIGDTVSIDRFKRGNHDGESKEFFTGTKIIKTHGFYKNDWKIGLWTEYYDNGQLKSQGEFYPQKRWLYNSPENYKIVKDSLVRSQLDTTVIMFPNEQFFKNGKWSYWTKSGKLYLEEWWHAGNIISSKHLN